ncbi:MAG: undecaprenyl-diphosphate phosphatase [Lachnospiraceae bacterium]|nr:undecaprenyl-diphosphate phosphatase [Lachnospiraceae bacterium]
MNFINWLRVVVLGILEGITEWLPISSTGHLVLLDALWKGDAAVFTESFTKIFDVVIQLGAILAVVTVFFHKLNPVSQYKTDVQKKNTRKLWLKILIAVLPAVVVGLLLDDWMDEHLYTPWVIASMLILYGALFIVIEKIVLKDREPAVTRFAGLTYRMALIIGLAQCLAVVPGTSRSGVTILCALLLGCSRYLATEFTFYLAIPVMLGASGLKLFKYLFLDKLSLSGAQIGALFLASAVAYVVSLFVIRFMIRYVKRHDFTAFGIYRIVLGILVLVLFGFVIRG